MKKSVLLLAVGIGIGYVLGARAGRERYDQIVDTVSGVWDDPRVVKARRDAARYAREQAPALVDRAQALGNRAQTAAVSATKSVSRTVHSKAADVSNTARDKAADVVNTANDKANEVATRAGEAREAMLDNGDGLSL